MDIVTDSNSIAILSINITDGWYCDSKVITKKNRTVTCNRLLAKSNETGIIAGEILCPNCKQIKQI